jgi:hypothetical protein
MGQREEASMRKRFGIALLACLFVLCLSIVGCGGSDEKAAKDAFTGTWDLVEMESGDKSTGADEFELFRSLGYDVYLNMNEDGSCALVLFGSVSKGTWAATSPTAGTTTIEDLGTISMSIADSKLTLEQDDAKLVFEKGEAKETPPDVET